MWNIEKLLERLDLQASSVKENNFCIALGNCLKSIITRRPALKWRQFYEHFFTQFRYFEMYLFSSVKLSYYKL